MSEGGNQRCKFFSSLIGVDAATTESSINGGGSFGRGAARNAAPNQAASLPGLSVPQQASGEEEGANDGPGHGRKQAVFYTTQQGGGGEKSG